MIILLVLTFLLITDIVIVSYNLLQNKNYVAYPNDPKTFGVKKQSKRWSGSLGIGEPSVAELTAFKRMMLLPQLLDQVKDKPPKSIKGVILDHFHWHRIVMDEGHELITDKTVNGTDVLVSEKKFLTSCNCRFYAHEI